MPPPLHPRSGFTTSLFGTTLAVSFLVVGLPHIIPCPADSRQYAEGKMKGVDENGRRRRISSRQNASLSNQQRVDDERPTVEEQEDVKQVRREINGTRDRECPVPKPGGIVGRWMGFSNEKKIRPNVKIEKIVDKNESGGDGG